MTLSLAANAPPSAIPPEGGGEGEARGCRTGGHSQTSLAQRRAELPCNPGGPGGARRAERILRRSCRGTTDYHTAGEPFRIVTAGARPTSRARPCAPARARAGERRGRRRAAARVQRVRRARRHVPAASRSRLDAAGTVGVPFWHKDGFGLRPWTIALGARAVEVSSRPRRTARRTCRSTCSGRVVSALSCAAAPCRTSRSATCRRTPPGDVPVATPLARCGRAAYGGAIYAKCRRPRPALPSTLRPDLDRARPGGQGRARGRRARSTSERRPAPASTGDRGRRPRYTAAAGRISAT